MNLPHVHLLLNHFPIIGTIIALGMFLLSLVVKSDDLKRMSLVIFAGLALLSIPTYMSGNGAEQAIRTLPGVSHDLVAAHNNAAVVSLIFVELTGMFAWLALWQYRRFLHARRWTIGVVVLLSAATLYFMTVTGNTGGAIRHAEINGTPEVSTASGGSLVNAAALSEFVTGTKWMWPTCETLHFVGLSLLMGVVFLIDLRMLGVIRNVPFRVAPAAALGNPWVRPERHDRNVVLYRKPRRVRQQHGFSVEDDFHAGGRGQRPLFHDVRRRLDAEAGRRCADSGQSGRCIRRGPVDSHHVVRQYAAFHRRLVLKEAFLRQSYR